MLNFSIMAPNEDHIDEICNDIAYQINSGVAYRKKLEKYSGFYNELVRITKELSPFGCRIPLATTPHYILSENDVSSDNCNGWCSHILDRFGLPTYFGASCDGKYKNVDFKKTGNTLSLDVTVLPFDPIILIMESFCR